MDSLRSLRQTAATRYDEIEFKHHRNQKSTMADMAADVRDAFEGLQLEKVDDPQAQALAKAMKPLAVWAGGDARRSYDVYSTGLQVAGQVLGGPMGVGLAGGDRYTPIGVSALASKAGDASRELLEAVVPESWSHATDYPQWDLGQQLGLMREGRADLAGEVGWLRGHMKGREVHAADIEQNQAQRSDFTSRYASAGWSDCLGQGPWELEGREVAMLYPTPGKLEEFRGVVEGSRQGLAAFTLRGHDKQFNSNSVSAMVVNGERRF